MSAIKDEFEENGYYVAKGLFNASEINYLVEDFDRIVDQLMESDEDINARWKGDEQKIMGTQDTVIYHTHNVQRYSSRWRKAIMCEKFLDIVEEIIGEDIILHHSKLFQKPAGNGSPFPFHQDYSYFPTIADSMMAGIIHVTDATDEMGCLRVMPGSHKLGPLENSNGQSNVEFLEKYPLEEGTILEAEAGDVVFFHYFTLHGSMPNVSSKVRKTVLTQMYSGKDAIVDSNSHFDEKLVLRGWNYNTTRSMAGV
ncbi:MAG: phytanoyl-CoA dioxygenase [Planctomycetota bacterium]|nr:MAG: phytanoyl-CoA dioxygenase [Planctomycetota bacterium]